MEVVADRPIGQTIKQFLRSGPEAHRVEEDVAQAIMALVEGARGISALIRKGPLAGALGSETGGSNSDGDTQKKLDVTANGLILEALSSASVRYFASEEEEAILTLDEAGKLGVAVDPLDGSSNIDVNISIGTIFSIYRASEEGASATFFRPGRDQVAAGYFVYGPHTALVMTTGNGTQLFILDPEDMEFKLADEAMRIVPTTSEFAINASNYRHWRDPVRTFVDDCIRGAEGPHGRDFNMRWIASLVAETHRIFSRGGVFLYPSDERKSYARGRLRLLYEAAPIAFLVEQAGGQAIDGVDPILDLVPRELHQRTPLIFGSAEKVTRIQTYHTDPRFTRDPSPLFNTRGLFSA